MSQKIAWSYSVQAAGSSKLSGSGTVEAQAVDQLEIEVPGGTEGTPGEAAVQVQPADDLAQVRFLALIPEEAEDPAGLSYSVTGGAADVALDAPQVFIGGAVGLLQAAPETITFENTRGAEAATTVTILVGRQATSS